MPPHVPLGEVCVSLGLLQPEQVHAVLRADLDTRRFGERALRMGLLDDESLARALAHQTRVNMVPGERLERLQVDPDVLDLLPTPLMRERLLLPTFLDPETRVLSLIVADPADSVALRAAQSASGAGRLRVFVGPRRDVQALLDRLVPAQNVRPPAPPAPEGPDVRVADVVFEPDPDRARALNALAETEDAHVEVVTEVSLVGAVLEAGGATRVVLREALLPTASGHVPTWMRLRPGLVVRVVPDHGPQGRSELGWHEAGGFLLALLEDRIAALPEQESRAARGLLELLDRMAPERPGSAWTLATRWAAAEGLATEPSAERASRIAAGAARMRAPAPVTRILEALSERLRGEGVPGDDPSTELLFSAAEALREGVGPGPAEAVLAQLGARSSRHDAVALSRLLRALGPSQGTGDDGCVTPAG